MEEGKRDIEGMGEMSRRDGVCKDKGVWIARERGYFQ